MDEHIYGNGLEFIPIRGTETKIKNQDPTLGLIYFATDTISIAAALIATFTINTSNPLIKTLPTELMVFHIPEDINSAILWMSKCFLEILTSGINFLYIR